MTELKPCPWCGGEMRVSYHSKGYFRFQHITFDFKTRHCLYDEIDSYIVPLRGIASLADAIEAWNRRVDDDRT